MKKILIYITLFFSTFSFSARKLDTKLVDFKGQEVKLSDYKGKPTYIELWASWCPICLNTLKDTDEFFSEKDNFNKITIVFPSYLGEKDKAEFKKWFNGLGYKNVKVLFDEKGYLANTLRIRGFPANVFINSNSEIEVIRFGHMTKQEIRDKISQIK